MHLSDKTTHPERGLLVLLLLLLRLHAQPSCAMVEVVQTGLWVGSKWL